MERILLGLFLVAASACESQRTPKPETTATGMGVAPTSSSILSASNATTPVATTATTPAAPTATISASATPSASSGAADVLSPAKAVMPPEANWESAPSVTVTLSERFACKTTHLGEYFRVRCTEKATGGLPEFELLTRADRRVAKETDAVAIILPYVENESVAVRLTWKDETATLVVHGRTKPREGEPFGIFYLSPPKNEQTAPNCPPDTLRGPDGYCLVACTSLPVDTCPSTHSCVSPDVDGEGPTCVPDGKTW